MRDQPLLDVSDLSVSLPASAGPLTIIKNVDLCVNRGEFVGVAGESGSGKSLTALTLLNLLPVGSRVTGNITFDGQDLTGLNEREWQQVRGRRIALLFQDATAALHPMLTIGRQLTEHMRHSATMTRRAADERAAALLDRVRIPNPRRALKSYAHQFSGGMRQRIAIAIALACRPRLLIADEPTTGLDVTVQAGILELLDDLRREQDLAVLFITHDLGVLSSLTQRAYVFYSGRVLETGPTGLLLTEPTHPYTHALLRARPHGLTSTQTLQAIPGAPAVPGNEPAGCPFAPRCAFVEDRCRDAVPPLVASGPDRSTACVVRPRLNRVAS